MLLYCTLYKPSTIRSLTSAFLSPAEVSIKSPLLFPFSQWLTIHTYLVYRASLCLCSHLSLCYYSQVLSGHYIAFLSLAEYIAHLCASVRTSPCATTLSIMPFSFFDPELAKALFHLAGESEFSVLGWPLTVLMVLRRYQSFVAYGFTASIVIAFFIGQLYLVQIEHSVAIVHAFAIHLQNALVEMRWMHSLWPMTCDLVTHDLACHAELNCSSRISMR